MIYSMTGFGKGVCKFKDTRVLAEIKTLNHRYFEVSARLPNHISYLEDKIRNHIHQRVKRGRVNLNLVVETTKGKNKFLSIDRETARGYFRLLNSLKRQLGLKEDISINYLVTLPDVIKWEQKEYDIQKIWPSIKTALDKAIDRLVSSRQAEGRILCKDLLKRIAAIEILCQKVKARSPKVVADYRRRLREKIEKLQSPVTLNNARLETEVTLFARNCDITEETTRTFSHIENFRNALLKEREAGRKLDFIAQELFREVNTVGAKASDTVINRRVIAMKELIEQIREQVQNVE